MQWDGGGVGRSATARTRKGQVSPFRYLAPPTGKIQDFDLRATGPRRSESSVNRDVPIKMRRLPASQTGRSIPQRELPPATCAPAVRTATRHSDRPVPTGSPSSTTRCNMACRVESESPSLAVAARLRVVSTAVTSVSPKLGNRRSTSSARLGSASRTTMPAQYQAVDQVGHHEREQAQHHAASGPRGTSLAPASTGR